MATTETQTHAVFVAMPFGPEYDEVFEIIKQAAVIVNMRVERIDQKPFAGSIISHITESINLADFVVAVVSEANGNVYYEIGLAHCQKKPVILLTSDPKTLLFDLRDHRAIVYDLNKPQQAVNALAQTLSAVSTSQTSSDPKILLVNSFSGLGKDSEDTYKSALEKIWRTANLQEPVEVMQMRRTSGGDLAVELKDFNGDRIRAVVDVNGIIRSIRRME